MSELDHYAYELPQELIAQAPLPQRTDARLLVVDRAANSVSHRHVRDLPDILSPGDCLVLNDTRVVPARLDGHRTATGGRWQGLFLDADDSGAWRILSKTRGRLEPGETITLQNRDAKDALRLRMLSKFDGGTWLVRPESDEPVLTLLEKVGRVPLPHYVRDGNMVPADWETYQTVFAKNPGAVAAPTAGLHFTEKLLDELEAAGIATCRTTLHVGLGTFRPIKAERLADHVMHREWASVTQETVDRIQTCRQEGGRVVAVGTTVVRALESSAAKGQPAPFTGFTDLFIRPPYQFHAVDVMMTNFHLPKTTLLVLVRTFGGDELMQQAYQEAIDQRYRFYSYGDTMLIL